MSHSVLSVPLHRQLHADQTFFSSTSPGPAPLPAKSPTKSFWLPDDPQENPLANEGSTGNLTTEADVVIIGSGITGVSAAYHLGLLSKNLEAGRELKIVMLEARSFCSGATGRNGGHLTAISFAHLSEIVSYFGDAEAKKGVDFENYTVNQLSDLIKKHGWASDVDYVENRTVTLLFTEQELKEFKEDFKIAQGLDVSIDDVQWMERADVLKKYGADYPAFSRKGSNVWPMKLATKIFQLTKSLSGDKKLSFSLSLHTHTPALSVTRVPSSMADSYRWSVLTSRGSLKCRYVLHATNAYASHLLPHLQGPKGIIPARGQVIATPGGGFAATGWIGNEGFEYWFERPATRANEKPLVILGGGREVPDHHELYNADDSRTNPQISKALKNFLPGLFPGRYESGTEPAMEWTGVMGFTAINDPFVGPVIDPQAKEINKYEGQYVSAGYSGHGMPRAAACAEVVAEMIVSDILKEDDRKLPSRRLPSLPKRYLMSERL